MFVNPRIAILAACTLVSALGSSRAEAQVKPFKIIGEGLSSALQLPFPVPVASPHAIVGVATQLGRHTGSGSVLPETANFNPDGSISGEFGSGEPFVFVGANGEILSCNYGHVDLGASEPGEYKLVPIGAGYYVALFEADFVPIPDACTGKFAGVTGRWVMYAVSEPFQLGHPFHYAWEGQGTLTFQKGK